MRSFCTIITSNYFPFAVALYKSLIKFHSTEKLIVLVIDDGPLPLSADPYPGISMLRVDDVFSCPEADLLYHKYHEQSTDALRWSFKPLLIRYLLDQGFQKVIYTDCDIFFFNDYEFLFEELDKFNVLLTPCWRTIDYEQSEDEFNALYTDGLFNAGFIAAGKEGLPAIKWWMHACSYRIEINPDKGLFVDQKYLDVLPLMFERIKIIQHKGCNVAFWNQHLCKRVKYGDEVKINGEFPIIFMHITNNYIIEFLEGQDPLLYPYFKKFEKIFEESGFTLKQYSKDLPEYNPPGCIVLLKRKLKLRTRFKKIIHNWTK